MVNFVDALSSCLPEKATLFVREKAHIVSDNLARLNVFVNEHSFSIPVGVTCLYLSYGFAKQVVSLTISLGAGGVGVLAYFHPASREKIERGVQYLEENWHLNTTSKKITVTAACILITGLVDSHLPRMVTCGATGYMITRYFFPLPTMQ